jgi:hypothetical protein
MQKFTSLHDGSIQGWHATYLAFHIAAQLGAPLQVLLINSGNTEDTLEERAAHVETGGRAAGVTIETHLLGDFSIADLKEHTTAIDGLFVPQRLISDGESATVFLETVSCPLWIASREPDLHEMAVLVSDLVKENYLLTYTKMLAQRLQQSLTGLINESELDEAQKNEPPPFNWIPYHALTLVEITSVINQLQAGLLFISASNTFPVTRFPYNCVICPDWQDA